MKSNTDKSYYWAPWVYVDPANDNYDIELYDPERHPTIHGHSVYKRIPDEHGHLLSHCIIDASEEQCVSATNILNEQQAEQFPNGFTSWYETHHEIVEYIQRTADDETGMVHKTREGQGIGALYEMGQELTDEFEKLHAGREWDGEFLDEVEIFLKQKEEAFIK